MVYSTQAESLYLPIYMWITCSSLFFSFKFQVIARIFYCVNSSWTGRITVPELRNSNFLQVSDIYMYDVGLSGKI